MAEKASFFAALGSCSTGERAALRRNCGAMIAEADGQAVMTFYRCLPPDVPRWQENHWFAAACFSCLWDAGQQGMPMENAIYILRSASDSFEHRLVTLLDMRWEADGFLLRKLCRIIKMAKGKGLQINCETLLEDLLFWNSSNQGIQRKWARAMYIKSQEKEQEA
mgnify:CR=1 FL=1